uniref:SET domain-containing protein n=1 Tax=Mesocestoides corti TaxID=53468 RepID=A0A5K3F1D1_MESCO
MVQYLKDDTSALRVFTAGRKGLGVRATRGIRQGEFVCAFSGSHMDQITAKTVAYLQASAWNHIYVMIVREFIGDNIHPVFESAVDGVREAINNYVPHPLTCRINHSCEPNMTVVPVRVNSTQPIMALFAIRDIAAHEELSYDYTEKSREVAIPPCKQCLCGAWKCRRLLPHFV